MKSGNCKSIVAILFFCFFVLHLNGQNNNVRDHVTVRKNQVHIIGDGNVLVDLEITLNGVAVSSSNQLTLTPVIRGENNYRVELPPVIVNGKSRANLYKRSLSLGGSNMAHSVITANPKTVFKTIPYRATTRYAPWMKNASVYLIQDLCGCGGGGEEYVSTMVANGIGFAEFKANFVPFANFIQPQKEDVKKRDEHGEAYIVFETAKWDILPRLSNNSRELEKIRNSLQYVRDEPTTQITAVLIEAFASPEAPYDYNMNLSRNRANALADYVRNTYNVPAGILTYRGMGEDWASLEEAVNADMTIPSRTDILRIIRNNSSYDEKENQLKALAGGSPYNFLLTNLFPRLRRADYRIEYTVPPYSLEKGKELLQSKPNMLSLEEMYQIALTYEGGSAAFNNAFLQAAKAFPNDRIARLNGATANILEGNYQEARQVLEQYLTDPDAWNSLGLVYMYLNNFQQAQYYLERARERGIGAAQENLRSLEKVREQYSVYIREKLEFENR